MIVVADASPLIFLAKIRKLDLLHALFRQDIRLPRAVCREVVVPGMDPIELEVLEVYQAVLSKIESFS
jgi:predicted nucleic acid-binding protein